MSREIKLMQKARCERVQEPDFLEKFLEPHINAGTTGAGWETEVIQLDGSGAATVRVTLDGGHPVFAKVFAFDDGPATHRKLTEFRAAGFGTGSRYQSVEPLAWYDEYDLLICTGAHGSDVESLFDVDRDAWRKGVSESGAWLGLFHSSGLSIGEPLPFLVTSELISLAKRMGKAMAEHPLHLELSLSLLKALDAFTHETVDGFRVQSHGQYRAKHVFVSDNGVTVIDLDRSSPADPSRDVAEYIQRLRNDTFELCGSVEPANAATHDFLEAYTAATGSDRYLTNFRFHYARHLVHRVNRVIKKGILATDEDTNSQFLLSELENLRAGNLV